MQYKTIDLCAGIGGIRRGFELTGKFYNVASAEIDENACRTYEHIFGDNPRNDITSTEFKNSLVGLHYDVLLAGFPCQAFSSVGLRQGFKDKIKGTIFFDVADIIEMTRPKAVFLENVQNLVTHDNGNTFETIIETLDKGLNYKVIGVCTDDEGNLKYNKKSFIRNSRYFGIPQNRPRVYIIAFNRDYFGNYVKELPESLPEKRERNIYESLEELFDKNVSERFFISSGYLETLEKHVVKQKAKGYGFGYKIINAPEIENPVASTLLATGGSGKERNLVYDKENGEKYAGKEVKGKYSPINSKNVRSLTPNEWGKLQGFINYGFLDEQGNDRFSFPENVAVGQQYKQFGNSVTIPVIEEMANFILNCFEKMTGNFNRIEKRLYSMYGTEHKICNLIYKTLKNKESHETIEKCFNMVFCFGCNHKISKYSIMNYLNEPQDRTEKIICELCKNNCLVRNDVEMYSFEI